jgi:hypothetical protein
MYRHFVGFLKAYDDNRNAASHYSWDRHTIVIPEYGVVITLAEFEASFIDKI